MMINYNKLTVAKVHHNTQYISIYFIFAKAIMTYKYLPHYNDLGLSLKIVFQGLRRMTFCNKTKFPLLQGYTAEAKPLASLDKTLATMFVTA